MREKIFRAAGGDPEPVAQASTPAAHDDHGQGQAEVDKSRGWPPDRVARGTVRRVLRQVMSQESGMTIADITSKARAVDSNISGTSIPNELRRNLGTLYRQEGSVWFLSDTSDKETTGIAINETPAVVSRHN